MPCLTCNAERITRGSARVLPELRRRLPLDKLRPASQYLAMPAILAMTGYMAFAEPRSMTFIVSAWLLAAHHLGHTKHCPPTTVRRKRRRKGRKSDEQAITRYEETYHPRPDPPDVSDGLQRHPERQEATVVPDAHASPSESELIR